MPGIANLSIEEFGDRVHQFKASYKRDWWEWVDAFSSKRNVATQFGIVLRRWQACRPNRMRRTIYEAVHGPPYLEDLIAEAEPSVDALRSFDLRLPFPFASEVDQALENLWQVFRQLSYHGYARNRRAGIVAVSKAVLLLTEGRVGPAFDSNVRRALGIATIESAREWIEALRHVSSDIQDFERVNRCTLQQAAPSNLQPTHSGRIYDMALGPRE